jgi:hypothetical protein
VYLGCASCANQDKLGGAKVLEEHIYMVGVCADCMKKGKTREGVKKVKSGS